MLLDHQDEPGFTVEVVETTSVELNLKVDGSAPFFRLNSSSTLGIVAVTLDVHDAMEVAVCHVDQDLNSIGQTVDSHLRSGEVANDGGGGNGRAADLGVTGVTLDTCAFSLMVDWLARCTVSIGTARITFTDITTSVGSEVAVLDWPTIRINSALWFCNNGEVKLE